MTKLHFIYRMHIQFDSPVEKHRFTLKCSPQSSRRQEITQLAIEVFPKEFLSTDEDSFGNTCIYGYSEHSHDHFSVLVEGNAVTGLSHYETAADVHKLGMYQYATHYTVPGKQLRAYAAQFRFSGRQGNCDRAEEMMRALHRDFRYVQKVTDIGTTAEEALALGCGVCQDYAHILIALCHMRGIPARYVVGMLVGEGLSHAWVEVYEDGMWIGLDPTNNAVVKDQHIKISSGRDYRDCTINQGIFTGGAKQTQTISVRVEACEP